MRQSLGNEEGRRPKVKSLLLWIGVLAALLLFLPSLAVCQGCALCYTQASSGSRMIEALRSGILILIVPPTLMSVGVILVAYSKRNQFRKTDAQEDMVSGSTSDFLL
jgi:hypothetical protein